MTVIMAAIISKFPGQPDIVFAAVALAGLFQIVMGMLDIGQYIRQAFLLSLLPQPSITFRMF